MDGISNPHDRLFKEIWSDRDVATDFLNRYLPADVRAVIQTDTLEICKDSFVQADLREYFSDLLYRVSIHGRSGYLYLLLEHKSWQPALMALQLLGYIKGIWELHLKQAALPLPAVIPIVLYHGRDVWHASLKLSGLLGDVEPVLRVYIPEFCYQLIDLSRYGDEEIKGAVMTRVGLLLLKAVFSSDYREKIPGILSLLKELIEKKTGMAYIETVLRYIFHTVEGMSVDELKPVVEQNLSIEKGGLIMTLAEKIRDEGIQQGVQQGIQQGLLEGIESLLEIKFGKRGLKLVPAIGKILDTDRLRRIKEAIKVSREVQDVENVIWH